MPAISRTTDAGGRRGDSEGALGRLKRRLALPAARLPEGPALIVGLLALVTLAWALDLPAAPASASTAWVVREHALHLTGLWAFALLTLALLLATRPAWLEQPLGGLDRLYRVHRHAGLAAGGAALLHWLVELSDDAIKALFGREGRLPKMHDDGLLEAMRDAAEDFGEWAIYALAAMLALALWRRFPYGPWRRLHRLLPVIYLMLAFHAALLAPAPYWTQAAGAVLALLIVAGGASAWRSLAARSGRGRRVEGTIESVHVPAPEITELVCRLGAGWRGHRAGQFALVTFDAAEGAHPFTIASAERGDARVVFQIKALGDYTRSLPARLRRGQAVTVEGPYGRFEHRRARAHAVQLWIAAGIGVTPFLAWLEDLASHPQRAPTADFYYCTRSRDADPFVARLAALCAPLPTLRLHVVSSDRDPPLTARTLFAQIGDGDADLWFCGPRRFGEALRRGFDELGAHRVRVHAEAFALR